MGLAQQSNHTVGRPFNSLPSKRLSPGVSQRQPIMAFLNKTRATNPRPSASASIRLSKGSPSRNWPLHSAYVGHTQVKAAVTIPRLLACTGKEIHGEEPLRSASHPTHAHSGHANVEVVTLRAPALRHGRQTVPRFTVPTLFRDFQPQLMPKSTHKGGGVGWCRESEAQPPLGHPSDNSEAPGSRFNPTRGVNTIIPERCLA